MNKSYFKLTFLMVFLSFLWGCQHELLQTGQDNNLQSQKITIQRLSREELQLQHPDVMQKVENLISKKHSAKGIYTDVENGFIIDTDVSVYIQDRYGNKTYTFEAITEQKNPSVLQNIVLKDLGDGTFSVWMANYDQEILKNRSETSTEFLKQQLTLDNLGDKKGSDIFGKYSMCFTPVAMYEYIPAIPCTSPDHHTDPSQCDCGTAGHNCTPPTPAGYEFVYYIGTFDCSGGSSGNTTGSDGSTTGGTHGTGGNGGTTLPVGSGTVGTGQNVGLMLVPCDKIVELFGDPNFIAKYNEMTQPSVFNLNHEKVYAVKYPASNSGTTEPQYISADLPDCAPDGDAAILDDPLVYGLMHDHQNESCNPGDYTPGRFPSHIDIRTFINTLMPHALVNTGSYGNAYSLITTSSGNYMLTYSAGNDPGSINPNQLKLFENYYRDALLNAYNKPNYTQKDVEAELLKFIKNKVNKPGLEVYRVTANSATRIEYNFSSPNKIKETPCN